jgi:UDP-2-acetamido-2,6-beta-L-arabino-hexul-4-ose reductase
MESIHALREEWLQNMKILITGAKGFVGKNLIVTLERLENLEIYHFDIDTDPALLDTYTKDCEFVFHLAGVNRPQNVEEFMEGNFGFTSVLLNSLKNNHNTCPILITSSIQADLDNPYGQSKKAGEDLLFSYGQETGAKVLVYRLPNVFGKWCRPNYNSAVATFCHNIAHDLPVKVNDPDVVMNLVYIDDVVEELIRALNGKETREGDFCIVPIVHTIKLGEIVELIYSFKNSHSELSIPNMADAFTKKLNATYLSYLPEDQFSYPLKMNADNRGSFTEMIRTPERGQVSVNISKPGITKGNHWHHTKNEKFLVVSGRGVIRFRKVGSDKVIEYHVSGEKLEVVDIPTGYTHNIENLGDSDMVTIMWANECFDPEKPDTYFLEV